MTEFTPFPKIPRLNRGCVVTEKMDGTNASIFISDDQTVMLAGSRNRWLTLESDNFGFAKWVCDHRDELVEKLGPGRHFGEWWGVGIQAGYGLSERRFSLFNTGRWTPENTEGCCFGVVPVLYQGPFTTLAVEQAVDRLRIEGSRAAPGFMKPEGVIVWHEAARQLFKVTCHKDESPKGA